VPFRNFTVTRNFVPFTGTGKKRGTPTRTATNQTAGPLACIDSLPLMTLKQDITERIRADFKDLATEATDIIMKSISKTDYLETDRIIRCIIYLSEGDLPKLSKYIETAINDPRDVMLWAEYDSFDFGTKAKRVRNFNKTFGESDKDVK
jgi:uncharacterized protein YfaA (DUF2138 family)